MSGELRVGWLFADVEEDNQAGEGDSVVEAPLGEESRGAAGNGGRQANP